MKKFNTKLAPATEILFSMLASGLNYKDEKILTENPKSFLHASADLDVGDIDIVIVKNEPELVNIALPYYSLVQASTARALDFDDLEEVVGGEVVVQLEKQGINMVKEGVYKNGGLNGGGVIGHALVEKQRTYILQAQGLLPREPAKDSKDDVYSEES